MDDLSPPAGPTLVTGGSGGVGAARVRRPAAQGTTGLVAADTEQALRALRIELHEVRPGAVSGRARPDRW